ncbi:MAG: hypothetical protein CML66_05320 [Rhodobacteraceae bacterium]|nr:hypothetical protein [Paracoccaceae bacterium]MAY45129.1 hypothetical protein [Paracoccaceae bacterium]
MIALHLLDLSDSRRVQSDGMTPRRDWQDPPTQAELHATFHALADPVLGCDRAARIEAALDALPRTVWAGLAGPLT